MATTNSAGRLRAGLLTLVVAAAVGAAAAAESVHLEELTSPELKARIERGTTTALIPIGGTEQNGPHMVLGKHNVRARWLAGRIAEALGDAVVAPVLAYVPEGGIDPPQAHMRFTGTISVPEPAFEALLEGAVRSLRQHGLCTIVLLGDHGGYQRNLQRVADKVDRAWARAQPRCRVLSAPVYYRVSQEPFNALLAARGHGRAEIGQHAGLADTALALAIDPALVRGDQLARAGADAPGVQGDPRRASAELGRLGVELIVEHTARSIRANRSPAVAR